MIYELHQYIQSLFTASSGNIQLRKLWAAVAQVLTYGSSSRRLTPLWLQMLRSSENIKVDTGLSTKWFELIIKNTTLDSPHECSRSWLGDDAMRLIGSVLEFRGSRRVSLVSYRTRLRHEYETSFSPLGDFRSGCKGLKVIPQMTILRWSGMELYAKA